MPQRNRFVLRMLLAHIQACHIAGMHCGALRLLCSVARNLDVWIRVLSSRPDLRRVLLQQQPWINQGIVFLPDYVPYLFQIRI
jgi:hypothetical protein